MSLRQVTSANLAIIVHFQPSSLCFSLPPKGLFLLYLFRFRNTNRSENTRSFWVNRNRNSIPVLVYKPGESGLRWFMSVCRSGNPTSRRTSLGDTTTNKWVGGFLSNVGKYQNGTSYTRVSAGHHAQTFPCPVDYVVNLLLLVIIERAWFFSVHLDSMQRGEDRRVEERFVPLWTFAISRCKTRKFPQTSLVLMFLH